MLLHLTSCIHEVYTLALMAIMTVSRWGAELCEGSKSEVAMSDKQARNYRFTSPLLGDLDVDENNWKRLRGKIMQFDGATGCRINNIGCKVDFWSTIAGEDELDRYMIEVVGPWAIENGYFPNRDGDTSPIEQGKGYFITQMFNLNSALTALDEETGIFKEQAFVQATAVLSEMVTAISRHVISCVWDRYAAAVTFDHLLSIDEVEAHFATVIAWAANNGFFPLRGEKTPSFERKGQRREELN